MLEVFLTCLAVLAGVFIFKGRYLGFWFSSKYWQLPKSNLFLTLPNTKRTRRTVTCHPHLQHNNETEKFSMSESRASIRTREGRVRWRPGRRRVMGAKLRSTREGRDPGTRGGNIDKPDTSASEPWPPWHQRKFESSEIAGSPLGRVPFLEEETLSRGGLMVKWRKEAGSYRKTRQTQMRLQPPSSPHKGKYRL